MAEETGNVGRVKSSKSTAIVLGYGRRTCHLIMKSTLWTKIHMSGVSESPKRLKANDPQMNIQMRNHKLLKQMPGELEHAVKCKCKQSCTLDDITNTLQDFEDESRERVAEVTKKKNSCHNCGSTDHYENVCPKAKKKVYEIDKVPEDSESESMGDAIREQSDEDQDPRV
ncbi:hypothetical protein O181_010861 [Austropuccinia psidii MF-1]|uniref:CCHC-type domain-containing protein n=1 Tax=Austropuccinia psidii MF-1 TaxID=1389203 RepID=A0A9Q3GKT9_9BASI|nr:hypothetical protein [Austropuccinia psidii MF-1]